MYVLPYKLDSNAETIDDESMSILRQSKVCTRGLLKVMHFGHHRFRSVRTASKTTGVMPVHGNTGKTPSNAVTGDDERGKALREHFDYLLQLGEVRATRVIATMVDGAQGHANRGETTVDVGNDTTVVYLPVSFGYRSCYKRYMAGLGYKVSSRPNGGVIVEGINGKPINRTEFVCFATYFSKSCGRYLSILFCICKPA